MKTAVNWIVVVGVLGSSAGFAEEACKPAPLPSPTVSLNQFYEIAEAKAKTWKSDAAPARLGNSVLGPIDEQGRSTSWSMLFYSTTADAHVAINAAGGMMTCWDNEGSAGRMPALASNFFRDGAKLYEIAHKEGGDFIARGYGVIAQTAAADDRHATWNLSFTLQEKSGQTKSGDVTIIVDANTGKLEKVLRN
jgi:hypothetical protein